MGIFQTVDMYKVQHKVASIEDLRDLLANKIDERYKADVSKASTGFKKFLTGNTADMLIIKKNGYHGMAITIDPYQEDRGYAIISMVPVTPNAMIEWLTRKAGILDKLVFNAIWGSPKAFRTNVEGSII